MKPDANHGNKPSLAVIGTGIAGLSAAYLLKNEYRITVFESQTRAGMGAHSIDYTSNGITRRIDIPARIFCRGYYDNLFALYDHIGVEIVTSDHSGIFSDEADRVSLHYGNAHWGMAQFSYLKGRSWLSPAAWTIGLQSRRFFARAKQDTGQTDLAALSFGECICRCKISTRAINCTPINPVGRCNMRERELSGTSGRVAVMSAGLRPSAQ